MITTIFRFEKKEKIYLLILIALLILDQATKIFSYHYFDNNIINIIEDNLWFQRHLNLKDFSNILIANKKKLENIDYWNKLLSILLIPQMYILYIYTKKSDIKNTKRYLLALVIIGVNILLGELSKEILTTINPNRLFIIYLTFILQTIVLPIGIFIFKDSYLKFIILLASVCNIGNLISFTYYPYHIVDMIGFGYTGKIYNLADIYGKLSMFLLILSPFYIIFALKKDETRA